MSLAQLVLVEVVPVVSVSVLGLISLLIEEVICREAEVGELATQVCLARARESSY